MKKKGPPLSTKPILLAGTWKRYSKKGNSPTDQDDDQNKLLRKPIRLLHFKCPYHANVIKAFEQISNSIVE
jgi:hypothetical protein